MEIGIGAVDLDRLVPHHGLQSELRLPVKFHERRLAFGVHQAKGMDAEAFHESERARNRAVRHDPHDHVHAFRHERNEIPEIIVSRLRLRKVAVGFLFRRMNQIGKLDRVLNEKDGNIVPDDVPVALLACKASPRSRAHPSRDPLSLCCRQRSRSVQTLESSHRRAGTDPRASTLPATRSFRNSRELRTLAHARPFREFVHGRSEKSSRENEDLPAVLVHEARCEACFGHPRWGCPAESSIQEHLCLLSDAIQPVADVSGCMLRRGSVFCFLGVFHRILVFESLALMPAPLPVSRAAHRDRRLLRQPPPWTTGERM